MKKFFLIGFILVILIAIPFTISFLQKQQRTQSHAAAATTLSIAPQSTQTSPINKNVNDAVDLNVMVDPGSNPGNLVSDVLLTLTWDQSILATTAAGFVPNTAANAFPAILEQPVYQCNGNLCTMTAEMSIGASSTAFIQSPTAVGTLHMTAKAATAPNTPTSVSFVTGRSNTDVLAGCNDISNPANCADQPTDSVLLPNPAPAYVAVAGVAPTATPTPAPSTTPTPGPTAATGAPVCTALNTDRQTSGQAPFSLVFTAIGQADISTTISNVTFNFGDGPLKTDVSGGGIGTRTVSVQESHTYNNPGTYVATAQFTDGHGLVNLPSTCTKTVTVTAAPTPGPGTPFPTAAPTATPTPTLVPSVTPTPVIIVQVPTVTVTPSGPGNIIVGIGAAGGVLSIIGAAIFFLAL